VDALAAGLQPLAGGFSGETFLAEAAGERTVVRIYAGRGGARGQEAPEVDAAVLRLVRGLVPVPEVLEVRRADRSAGRPGLLVTTFLPGRRLDLLLPGMPDPMRATIGSRVGEVLSRLAQMPTLRAGLFLDGDLRISHPPAGGYDLVDWVEGHLERTALESWTPGERDRLLAVADSAQSILDRVERTSLVHSDFNPKNLLADPETGQVTAVLDWEYARSGSPYDDLGNLLRFERTPAFADAVLASFAAGLPAPPENLLDLARAGDLWALVDLAARRDQHEVARRAYDQLHAIARSGDLHAFAPA
jgi:aminoglycoside phosphotransferase (APT) family kinase protein